MEKQLFIRKVLLWTNITIIMEENQPSWEDAVVVGFVDVLQCNEANIIPQEDDTVIKIRTWLRPTDFDGKGSEYRKHIASHLPGTSSWFLTSSTYQQWHDKNEYSMLWVRGALLSRS